VAPISAELLRYVVIYLVQSTYFTIIFFLTAFNVYKNPSKKNYVLSIGLLLGVSFTLLNIMALIFRDTSFAFLFLMGIYITVFSGIFFLSLFVIMFYYDDMEFNNYKIIVAYSIFLAYLCISFLIPDGIRQDKSTDYYPVINLSFAFYIGSPLIIMLSFIIYFSYKTLVKYQSSIFKRKILFLLLGIIGLTSTIIGNIIVNTLNQIQYRILWYIIFPFWSGISLSLFFIGTLKITNLQMNQELKSKSRDLKKTKNLYQLITEGANDLITIINEKFECDFVNKIALNELLGYKTKEFMGKAFEKLIHPQDLETFHDLFNTTINKGGTVINIRIKHKNGEFIWLESKARFYSESNKKLLVVISRDITKMKMEQEKLIKTKKRYKLKSKEFELKYKHLFENSPNGIILTDNKGFILDCNPISERIFKIKREIVIGKNYVDLNFFNSEQISINRERFEKLSRGGRVGPIDFEILFGDGNHVWINLKTSLIEQGEEIYIEAIAQDITKKKIIEQKLKESEEKYRGLVNNISDIIYELDINGKCSYVSHQLLGISGFSPEEMIGQNVFNFVHPDDLTKVAEEVKIAYNSDDNHYFEFRLQHKDGHYVPVFSRISSMTIEEKQKLTGVLVDITERKKVEQKLKESEEKFRTFTEQAFMGITIFQDRLIKYVNRHLVRIIGYSSEELLHMQPDQITKLIHPEDREFIIKQA